MILKKGTKTVTIPLTPEGIEGAICQADTFMKDYNIDSHSRMCYRLIIEEVLLDYRDEGGYDEFALRCTRLRDRVLIAITIKGEKADHLRERSSEITQKLKKQLNPSPIYRYKSGKNYILFVTKPDFPDLRGFMYVLSYLRAEKKNFIPGIILRFVNMALGVAAPLLSAWIIVAYSGAHIKKIVMIAVLIALQEAASSLITLISSRLLRKSYSGTIKRLQNNLTEKVLQIKTEHMNQNSNGLFIHRLTDETNQLTDSIDALLDSLTQVFSLISLLIAFAVISFKMFLFEVLLFTIYFFIKKTQNDRISQESHLCKLADERHAGFVGEMVKAHRDIKLLHCEDSFMQKLDSSISASVDQNTRTRFISMFYIFLRTQFVAWSDLIYMCILAWLMMYDGMTPETALTLYNYNGKTYACAQSVSSLMDHVYNIRLGIERLYQLVAGKDYSKERFGQQKLDHVTGDIVLNDVWFSYAQEGGRRVPVLKGINLHIREGETVAFIGRSGCGKSTILSLITRIFDPDKGEILLDGHSLRGLSRDTVRSNISMVSQMPYIFNMSIRDNLAIVKHDLTDEEMIRACRTACIHDDIMEFSDGYETVVGEGGVALSGGQRQRLALARSFLKGSPVLVLDEATSALDNLTQAKVREGIESLAGKHTILMVAHRLSTVIHCDRLFFIADGKVLAQGTHKELLEQCEDYRALYGEEVRV